MHILLVFFLALLLPVGLLAQQTETAFQPPRSASLLVLDSLAARYASEPVFVVDIATLPPGVTVADLHVRGLRIKQAKDTGCTRRFIEFRETRQQKNGENMFIVYEGVLDRAYRVQCKDGACHMSYPPEQGNGDYAICVLQQ